MEKDRGGNGSNDAEANVNQVGEEKPTKLQSAVSPHGSVERPVPYNIRKWTSHQRIDCGKEKDLHTSAFNPADHGCNHIEYQAQNDT